MRIGIDCRLWNETGVGRYIRNLVTELEKLDKKNYYVLFVKSDNAKDIASQIKNSKWRIKVVDYRWHTLKEQLLLPANISDEDLDVMHFPYFSVPIFYHKPYVVTIHDLILHHFPTGEASTLPRILYKGKHMGYKLIMQVAADKARKIIAVSNATKNEIVKHLDVPSDKVVVTYEGIDKQITNSKPQTSKDLSIKVPNSTYFLYVGNAYPHKNLDKLIKAFLRTKESKSVESRSNVRELKQNGNSKAHVISVRQSRIRNDIREDLQLVLVGKQDYFYKRLAKKYHKEIADNYIVLLGYASDEELAMLYKNALATVIPSLMEGFGLPALEAMAHNCLVLASDIPSLHEVCGEAAVYFDPHTTESIAETLHNVSLHRNKYEKQKKLGLDKFKQFSWEKMAEETLEVYESSV